MIDYAMPKCLHPHFSLGLVMNLVRACAFFLFVAAPVIAGEPIDYLRDVKPILAQHCVQCHGPKSTKGELRLDVYQRIKEGGNSGPAFVAGKPADSRLIIAISGGKGDVSRMPPKGVVPPEQVALLRRWVEEGARGPAKEEVVAEGKTQSTHWSFQPIVRPAVPASTDHANPIDHFVRARLAKEELTPSAEADRITLLRRASLDLTGLPPTLADVAEYLADTSPSAYEHAVDRMLKSPHYGEHQARLWLDAARYADSNGFSIDAPRSIWRYRDWVIQAFNNDLPFDQFTIDQLAGDLVPKATTEQQVATGFHRNTMINQEGGIDVEQFRVESVIDRVNTTGSVWLGLTVGCAQCHDHKFDPISHKEYYQFFAFFNNCDEPNLDIQTPEEAERRRKLKAAQEAIAKALLKIDPSSPEAVEKWERGLTDATRGAVPKNIAAIFLVAPNGRNAKQQATLLEAHRRADSVRHLVGQTNPLAAAAHVHLLSQRQAMVKELAELKARETAPVSTMVVRERKSPRDTRVLLAGDFTRPGVPVKPGLLSVLPGPKSLGANPTRLDLAKWLVSKENPLTPRVIVNRAWGHFFGTGIVETENDFGTQGTTPTHPELLDWLAAEFRDGGWSTKKLHRLIVTSATYRQSSIARAELDKVDARNRLLARQNRIRVPAEVVRDVALAASGLLNRRVGGPSVFPPQPEGVYRFTQIDKNWKASLGEDRYRRGMYTYFWRSAPHPQLVTFDAPDASVSCTRRSRSNTPLQALTLLNDSGFYEYAQGLAARIVREEPGDDLARLRFAFRASVSREPNEREFSRLMSFLQSQKADLAGRPAEAKQLWPSMPDQAAWVMVARVLLNLDETITRE